MKDNKAKHSTKNKKGKSSQNNKKNTNNKNTSITYSSNYGSPSSLYRKTMGFDVDANAIVNNLESGSSVGVCQSIPISESSVSSNITSDSQKDVMEIESDSNGRGHSVSKPRRASSPRIVILILCILLLLVGAYFVYTNFRSRPITSMPSLSPHPSFSPTLTTLPTTSPSTNPSDVPSSIPSVHHSSNPSHVPSFTPTDTPSFTPTITLTPTSSPTTNPTYHPSSSPTLSLSPSLSPSTIVGYIGGPNTAEGMAHAILIRQSDMQEISQYPKFRRYNETQDLTCHGKITQRFAMLTLWISLFPKTIPPPVTTDECYYPGVVCDRGVVVEVHYPRQGLTGTIPPVISQLSHLRVLDLEDNAVGGYLPDELYDLEYLERLYLHENRLMGTLRDDMMERLRELEYLFLGKNGFSGDLPWSLNGNKKEKRPLKYLSLCYNDFTGPLPSNLQLRDLAYLDLSFNRLTGTIPSDMFYKCYGMKWLYLDHNRLTGPIPVSTVTAGGDDLESLDLSYNGLTGAVPYTMDWAVDNKKFSTLNVLKNKLDVKISQTICNMSVFEYGDVVQLEADCKVCDCDLFCEWCWDDDRDDDIDDDVNWVPLYDDYWYDDDNDGDVDDYDDDDDHMRDDDSKKDRVMGDDDDKED